MKEKFRDRITLARLVMASDRVIQVAGNGERDFGAILQGCKTARAECLNIKTERLDHTVVSLGRY